MKPNYIFGLTRRVMALSEGSINSGWITNAVGADYNIPFGTPCLVIRNSEEPERNDNDQVIMDVNGSKKRRVVLIPFSNSRIRNNRLVLDNHNNINSLSVKVGQEQNLIERIREIEIPQIDPTKVDKIVEFVKSGSPLTLTVSGFSKKGIVRDLDIFTKKLSHKFRFSLEARKNVNSSLIGLSDNKVVLSITLLDIKHCFPVFDYNKSDGIFLYAAVVYGENTEKYDCLKASFEFSNFYSNNTENIFETDGQVIKNVAIDQTSVTRLINNHSKCFDDIGKKVVKKKETTKIPKSADILEAAATSTDFPFSDYTLTTTNTN